MSLETVVLLAILGLSFHSSNRPGAIVPGTTIVPNETRFLIATPSEWEQKSNTGSFPLKK